MMEDYERLISTLTSTEQVPLNCSNCKEPFDLQNSTPYRLLCGHTGKERFFNQRGIEIVL